jgi:hypothetical protein
MVNIVRLAREKRECLKAPAERVLDNLELTADFNLLLGTLDIIL